MKYTACIEPDENILFFAQADNPDDAISEFINGGELDEYIEYYEIERPENLKIEVFKTRHEESWDEEERGLAEIQGFKFFIGKKVGEKQLRKGVGQ